MLACDCNGRSLTFTEPSRCVCPVIVRFWLEVGAASADGTITVMLNISAARKTTNRADDKSRTMFPT